MGLMAHEDLQRLGELLIEEGVLVHEDVVRLIGESGLKGTALASLLEQAHHVKRADLAAFLAGDFVVPRIEDLRKFDLYDEAARLVPEALARKHELVPLAKMGDVLCVARPTYMNRAGLAELRKATGLRLKMFQAEEEQVLAALDRIYGKKSVEIPPPKAVRPAEGRHSAPVPEETSDGIPLIAIPEDPDQTPVFRPPQRGATPAPALEEVALEPAAATILEAVRVNPTEVEEEERRSGASIEREFEETFLGQRPFTPIRMA